jgi:hypothetical protein
MKNLYQRMTPETKICFANAENKYPNLISELKTDLLKYHFFTELPIRSAVILCENVLLTDFNLIKFMLAFD